jgi:hypothetical protein
VPNFKKHTFSARNEAGHVEQINEMVKIDADGYFYCKVPEHIFTLIPRSHKKHRADQAVLAKTFDALKDIVQAALDKYIKPTIKEERVIRYNIESHVSFAEMPNGDITPNAVPEGAEWLTNDEPYGGHHSANPAQGGYSLTIGAKAFTKITTAYGDIETITYEPYHGKGDHLQAKCPASILNSWCSFSLPRDPKEMAYTDEAATFFHKLMLAVAELSRKVQSFASDEKTLLEMIHNDKIPRLA